MRSPSVKKDWTSLEADLRSIAPAPRLELVQQGTLLLRRAGIEAPRVCAELLLAHTLGVRREDLYARRELPVSAEAASSFARLLRRRLGHEPLQYILGWTEFWSLRIRCDRRAFIPRPETELCVEATIEAARTLPEPVIADVGTGTGCIAAALAFELQHATLYASDLSRDALELARENLRALGLADRVTLLEGDLVQPYLELGLAGRLDIVVCNPPYVTEAELGALQAEVRLFEPPMALRAGADGLEFYRRLLLEVPPLLKPGGALIVETGDGQPPEIRSLAARTGWTTAAAIKDCTRSERVLVLTRTRHGHV